MITRTQPAPRLSASTTLQGLIALPWGATLLSLPRRGG